MREEIKHTYNKLAEAYYKSRKNKSGTSYFYNELLEMPGMMEMLGNLQGKKVLDIGCGPGFYIKRINGRCKGIKGVDISDGAVKIARAVNPGIEILVGDTEKLPFRNGEFDIAFASLVFGHLKLWDRALREIRRVLKSNGIFCFSVYNPVTENLTVRKWPFRQLMAVRSYFDEVWNRRVWKEEVIGIEADSLHHHKTYGTIIKLIVRNNFEIVDYLDCRPDFMAKKLFPKKYKEAILLPKFCVWKIRKK